MAGLDFLRERQFCGNGEKTIEKSNNVFISTGKMCAHLPFDNGVRRSFINQTSICSTRLEMAQNIKSKTWSYGSQNITTWEYEEQTKMKHLVFADYFDKWVQILGKSHYLNYFDCFGGGGAYHEGDKIYPGSPILAAQIAEKNKLKLDRDVDIVIIEKDKDNIENIKKIFLYFGLNVKAQFINDDFDNAINQILDEIDTSRPSFFFIDPFGFKIKLATLQRIMALPKAEILLNFMFFAISEFLDAPQIEKTLNDLFGCEDWKNIRPLKGQAREESIVDLYRLQLKKFSRFVCYYRLSFPSKARTYYCIFHLTNHILGCSIMKSCFGKYNFGRVEYRGRYSGQMTFSDLAEFKQEDISNSILFILKKPTSYLEILTALIDETTFQEKDIYSTIKLLESAGKIVIERDPPLTKTGRKRESITAQDIIMLKV